MKNSFRLLGGLMLVVVLLAGMSVLTVSAQGPTGTETPTTSPSGQTPAAAPPAAAAGTNNDNPLAANTLGSSIGALPPGSATWLKFDYNTNGNTFPRPLVMIRLLNGVNTGLGFEVWAPEQIQHNWWDNKAVGRGTPEAVPGTKCLASTGQPAIIDSNGNITNDDGSGFRNCTTNDLLWVGGFGTPGTYMVRVINNNASNGDNANGVAPQLIISGAGLADCQNGKLPQVASQLQGGQGETSQGQTAQGTQSQTGTGEGFSIVQCQNPTPQQLLALSRQSTTGQTQTSQPAAAPTVSASPTESPTAAASATTEASPTTAATSAAPTTAATAEATTAAPSAGATTAAPTAEATSTTTTGASSSAGSSTPAAAPSVSATTTGVPECTPTPTPTTGAAGTTTPTPTSAVSGTATPSPTPNCVMPMSSGSSSSTSSSSSSVSVTPAASATP